MPLDWDLVDTPLTSISAFAWSPSLSRLVACGDVYLYSDDGGINWTETTKPTPWSNDENSLCWDPNRQLFVCVLNNNFDTDGVVTSPDGINWTIRTTPSTGQWNAIAYNDAILVAVGNDGKAMYSSDAISWSSTGTDLVSLGATTDWDGLAWNPISELFVAVARGGNIRIATSPEGENWTGRHGFEVAYQKVWNSIACSPTGVMVATSEANGYDIMRSEDGEVWETPYIFQPIFAVSYAVFGIIWSDVFDKFMFIQWTNNVAVPDAQRAVVYLSEDAIDENSWVADEGILPGAVYDTGFGDDTAYRWNDITEAFELERWVAGFGLESETAIITSLEDAGPPVEPDTILELIGGEDGGGIEFSGGGSGYFEWGWAYTGSGGIEMGGDQTQMILSVDSSGIYTFIADQRFDRVYTRNADPDDTTDVKIPDPFIKTAYIGS